MIERYFNEDIGRIWEEANKVRLWQHTELAVMLARAELGLIDSVQAEEAVTLLRGASIDLAWWKQRESVTRHDLIAFIDERRRHLPANLQSLFHQGMTSYDTEEPAFATMLRESVAVVEHACLAYEKALKNLALRHRYTLMMGRTHGQEAQLMSFGKRAISWLQELRIARKQLAAANAPLKYSKLSGAIGNYTGVEPEVEVLALSKLGLVPLYGATQIVPRVLYLPLVMALVAVASCIAKVADDIWLGARSGMPILREPFGRGQRGSSAMPNKQNPITCEQLMKGMPQLVTGYMLALVGTCSTPTREERDIGDSCVERVAWPDLFHVIMRMVSQMTRVVSGLRVYPDNMLKEVVASCGCYASGPARDYLAKVGGDHGITADTAYRILQLVSFNAHAPTRAESQANLREADPASLEAARAVLYRASELPPRPQRSIEEWVVRGELFPMAEVELMPGEVEEWNQKLRDLFSDEEIAKGWHQLFDPAHLLKHESVLYREVLGR